MEFTHDQLAVMADRTAGFAGNFPVWVSAQGIVYLEVIHVVYSIDREGGYHARRKEDGSLLYTGRR